jgi:EAL domain-containing protein (putative c-di-GMP-specific phosphodiesterase class I)
LRKGIENLEVANLLKELGCDQGKAITSADPMPASELQPRLLIQQHYQTI